MQRYIRVSLLTVVFLGMGAPLWALNGAQLVGYSAVTEGMAGSGASAGTLDSSTMITNPAGLTELPNGFRMGFLLGFTNLSFSSIANPGAALTHNDDPILLPSGSVVLPFLEGDLVLGMGAFGVAGFGNDYSASPLGAGLTFATHSNYGLLKIVNAAGYKLSDQLSVGAAIHINKETLESNGMNPATLAQTIGGDRGDSSYGAGGSVGALYKPFSSLRIGASYTSEQFFNEFERYQDILPNGMNYPQQASLGAAYTPFDYLLLCADFRWINWSGAGGAFGDSLAAGGLGWQDQYIMMGGIQYQPWDILILRTGYNYGRSAIPSNAMFSNYLSTAIGKHHLGAGIGIRLLKNIDTDLSYMRSFSNTVTDTGAAAPGSSATLAGHQGSLDMTVRF